MSNSEIITLVSMIASMAMGFGMVRAQVVGVKETVSRILNAIRDAEKNHGDLADRVSRLEGIIEEMRK